jgi:hypothetical protein
VCGIETEVERILLTPNVLFPREKQLFARLATHGGSLKRPLLGSVADKILRAAPCPLLVVNPTAAGQAA